MGLDLCMILYILYRYVKRCSIPHNQNHLAKLKWHTKIHLLHLKIKIWKLNQHPVWISQYLIRMITHKQITLSTVPFCDSFTKQIMKVKEANWPISCEKIYEHNSKGHSLNISKKIVFLKLFMFLIKFRIY